MRRPKPLLINELRFHAVPGTAFPLRCNNREFLFSEPAFELFTGSGARHSTKAHVP